MLESLTEIVGLLASSVAQKRNFADDQELATLIYDLYGVSIDTVRELIEILLCTHKGKRRLIVMMYVPC